MLHRSSKKALAAAAFDYETGRATASDAARRALRVQPFGDSISAKFAAFVSRLFLYTSGNKPRRRRRFAVEAALRVLWAIVLFHLAFIGATSATLLMLKWVDPGATTLMAYRAIGDGWKVRPPRILPLAKIPRATRTMTIRVEDGSFFEHHGIELAAMKHAYKLNKAFGEPVYGGSTITMQTARTIFLVPEKSYVRKYLEVIIALEMEAILGKTRILELYFNYAEWGKGVFGIESAARYHYKAGIGSISRDQAIRLVTLLSSPIKHGPYTFRRNGILAARYAYLNARWGAAPPPVSAESPAPETVGAAAPAADAATGSADAATEAAVPAAEGL